MKKIFILLFSLTLMGNDIQAQVVYGSNEYAYVQSLYHEQVRPVKNSENISGLVNEPTGYKLSGLADNWFISLQGGFISFVGKPVSHTDFNGRTKSGLDISIGKWHSPYLGTRLVYQGFKFVDSQRATQSFGSYHADLLLNVSSFFRSSFDRPAKWNISPYVGAGFARLNRLKKNYFAFSYGVLGSYSLSERISLSMTLGGTTTRQNFDGYGKKGRFGDNLLSGSIGISIGIGHLGWKAKNYRAAQTESSVSQHPIVTDITTYPRNNYSGLKSLQERMANGDTENSNGDGSVDTGKFDAPILFFFKRNTAILVDKQQKVNIKEIAGAVKEYDLHVRIIGAADSKTGSPARNRALSIKRCRYIAKLLIKAGVPKSKMIGAIQGGINLYKPYTANRHACVILYKQEPEN